MISHEIAKKTTNVKMGETLLIANTFNISELSVYNSFSSEFCAEFESGFRFMCHKLLSCYNSECVKKTPIGEARPKCTKNGTSCSII